jgi:hypothetical protein
LRSFFSIRFLDTQEGSSKPKKKSTTLKEDAAGVKPDVAGKNP